MFAQPLSAIKSGIKLHVDFWRRRGKKYLKAEVIKISPLDDHSISISGYLIANVALEGSCFKVRKFREDVINFDAPLRISSLRSQFWTTPLRVFTGYRKVRFETTLSPSWADLPASQYNFTFATETETGAFIFKKDRHLLYTLGGNGGTVHIFFDEKSRGMRMEKLSLTAEQVVDLKEYAKEPTLEIKVNCIIGEYSICARDNGYALFEAIRKGGRDADPRINCLYPIEKINQDGVQINNDDIIEWGGFAHLKACIDADVLAFSHDKINIYPQAIKVLAPKRYKAVKSFFLQHGVTALKRSSEIHYNKKRTGFSSVNTCSEWEKSVFIKHFGFKPEEVFVGGFPRHDRLQRMNSSSVRDSNTILIFPTWRSGLARLPDNQFIETDYFKQWSALSTNIRKLSRDGKPLKTVFMMHPMLVQFSHLMEPHADDVQVASDFQANLMRCAALITDYSSICFESLYAGRDTFFFMFDADAYGIREDAYLNVETELFGPVGFNLEEMIGSIDSWAKGAPQNLSSSAPVYFDRIDDQNSLRIADHIVALSGKKLIKKYNTRMSFNTMKHIGPGHLWDDADQAIMLKKGYRAV